MEAFPDIITHNYDPARGICKNICHLPQATAEQILDEMRYKIRYSTTRRISANYLKRRFAVEEWLMAERTKKLGKTFLDRPIYFFLGDFTDGKDQLRPKSLLMKLDAFQPEMLTFTYPDSMASLPIALQKNHQNHRKDYHGKVFTLAEIKSVVKKFGMPSNKWTINPTMNYNKFIEIQVWDDRPIFEWLART